MSDSDTTQAPSIRVAEQTIVFANEPMPPGVVLFDDSDQETVMWSGDDGADAIRETLREAREQAEAERAAERKAERKAAPEPKATPAAPPVSGGRWKAVQLIAMFCTLVAVGAGLGVIVMDQTRDRVVMPDDAQASSEPTGIPLWSERPVDRALSELGMADDR